MDVDMIPTVFLGANQNQRTVTSSDVFVPVICNVYPFPCTIYFLLMFAFVVSDESFNSKYIVLQWEVIIHLYDTN